MASRVGPRATGSDGTDFSHREQIAGHYQTSAVNKTRLRYVIYLHFMLGLLMLLRLTPALLLHFSVQPPQILLDINLPAPMLWEYVWLTSVIPSVFGLLSLPRNRLFMIQQYQRGILLFGILPTIYGIVSTFGELLEFWQTRESSRNFLGFPVVVLWDTFLIIALQLLVVGLLLARSLANAWQPKKKSG